MRYANINSLLTIILHLPRAKFDGEIYQTRVPPRVTIIDSKSKNVDTSTMDIITFKAVRYGNGDYIWFEWELELE